jgi:arylsulfatase A-like enzyme
MRALRLPFTLLLAGLAACGGAEPAAKGAAGRWLDLARGYRPRPLEVLAATLEAALQPPRGARIVTEAAGEGAGASVWFELALPRAAWQRAAAANTWTTPEPRGGALLAGERTSRKLLDGASPIKEGMPRQPRAGRYWSEDDALFLTVADGAEPSDALVYRMRLDHGREVDGSWRVAQWDLACNGFLVFPGAPETLAVEVPPDSCLSFASVAPDPGGRGDELGPTTFRVSLDGASLLTHAQSFARPSRADPHRLELPAGRHTLVFEVEGAAPALIATPLVAPRAVGAPGARPWPDERPDVVLVLCDTFRADNLSAWGGKGLAPRLDAFVERSLRFLDARSAAAWTLPSIATILTGVFPGQHGGTDLDRGVSPAVDSVAEVLGRAGYRTVALTDSGLFSRHYGQDQGFQWFEESLVAEWNLNATLARARAQMAADDGRPLFLVVHTYRVHGPMRLGPDEDIQPYYALRVRVRERMLARAAADDEFAKMDVAMEFLDEGIAFYEDAVTDLDRKIGAWLEELERARFLEHGVVVLTADHGNAHGEHDQIGHGSDLYDVKLRVPLALAGRGIEPRAVRGAVSLVNLAPTLADVAGVEPARSWVGRSLLWREPSGPIYAFDLKKRGRQVALYAEGRKLMAPDVEALRAGEPSHAFDLGADPGENEDLAKRTEWPGELGRALAGTLEPLLVPAAEGRTLELAPEVLEQLEAIGYGGGDGSDK